MAKVESYRCDICGTLKKEANHWFVAVRVPYGAHIYVWDAPCAGHDHENIAHLCGSECATKFMMRCLSQEEVPTPSETRTEGLTAAAEQ